MTNKNEIVIYTTEDGQETFEVNLKEETVWLSQRQMAELFEKDVRTVNEHIGNIYKEKELPQHSAIRKFRIVQREGNRQVERVRNCYNLDIIISVGYRVKSQRGTQFRIWATNVLKNHLIEGYSIIQKRLLESKSKIKELQKTSRMIERLLSQKNLESPEATGLLQVILDYQKALNLLDEYDHQELKIKEVSTHEKFRLTYEKARQELQSLKNHSFVDGNKRIAASLFL
jgi:hypothetical protein